MEIFIYTLSHPITNEVKYVGKTNNPKRRLYSHIEESKRLYGIKSRRSVNWIKSLLDKQLKPVLTIIQKCNKHDWEHYEKYWIKWFRDSGIDLCNIEEGGKHSRKYFSNEKKIKDREFLRFLKSKFTEDEKLSIYNMIKNNVSIDDINLIFPEITKSFIYQIENGYKWNHITGISKPENTIDRASQRRNRGKGYFYNKQINKYVVVVAISKKKHILGKFENELDALLCVQNYRATSIVSLCISG